MVICHILARFAGFWGFVEIAKKKTKKTNEIPFIVLSHNSASISGFPRTIPSMLSLSSLSVPTDSCRYLPRQQKTNKP